MTTATATRQDLRESILDATDRLLARYGYTKLTMDDLAREVGIGKGTIYLHFRSKEELVLSHIDRIVERVKAEMTTIAGSGGDPGARLRRMLLARVLIRFDSVQHYTESLSDVLAAIRPTLLARRKRYFEEEAAILAKVLEEGARGGAFALDDAEGAAEALLTATNALLPYSLSRRELGERKDLAERTGRIASLLLDGLRARKTI